MHSNNIKVESLFFFFFSIEGPTCFGPFFLVHFRIEKRDRETHTHTHTEREREREKFFLFN